MNGPMVGDGHEHQELCGRIEHLMQRQEPDGATLVLCDEAGCLCGTFWIVIEDRVAYVKCQNCHATIVNFRAVPGEDTQP